MTDDPNADPGGPVSSFGGSPTAPAPTSGPEDPHGVVGADPGHGRFTGGNRVVLRGSGFAKKPRVWFGEAEVPAADVVAISEKKLQVVTPPHAPGPVDIHVQNGDDVSTRRTLKQSFSYDPFYADPDTGPTLGGTVLRVLGSQTAWKPGVGVRVGDKECGEVAVVSETELTCVTPPSTAGSRGLSVSEPSADEFGNPVMKTTDILDAFVYSDSENGYKGGLSGAKLPPHPDPGQPAVGQLKVLAFDSYTGTPLAGARVFVGTKQAGTIQDNGVALLSGVVEPAPPGPDGKPAPARLTVTVARKCAQPTTFVGVAVDTVTMYLDPVLSPSCGNPQGEIPPVGGKPPSGSTIEGAIQFPADIEIKKAEWSIVPAPTSPDERRVAYLFAATNDPRATFRLPDPSQAITEASGGTNGYKFSISSAVGNQTLYALAGIENRQKNPPTFTAYAFGLAKGVSTKPKETTGDVAIAIETTLDQSIQLSLDTPVSSAKGPDRIQTAVALRLGHAGYAIFPGAQRTTPLPLDGDISFVGLPPLTGALAGMNYVATALAATGPGMTLPMSSAGALATSDSSKAIPLDGFVRVPHLDVPGEAPWDGVSYQVSLPSGGLPPDLMLVDIKSGAGLVGWTVVTPGDLRDFVLPDLRQIPDAGLVPGPLAITVSSAILEAQQGDAFDYDRLLYRHLNRFNWLAYAQDAFYTQLPAW